jgi:sugar (pentulose or hexulose) kinase
LWRAALEAVTEQAAEIHNAMSAVSGPHRTLVVTGGWARSAGLIAVKRRRFGNLVQADVNEAGARGAALLAAKAAADESTAPAVLS